MDETLCLCFSLLHYFVPLLLGKRVRPVWHTGRTGWGRRCCPCGTVLLRRTRLGSDQSVGRRRLNIPRLLLKYRRGRVIPRLLLRYRRGRVMLLRYHRGRAAPLRRNKLIMHQPLTFPLWLLRLVWVKGRPHHSIPRRILRMLHGWHPRHRCWSRLLLHGLQRHRSGRFWNFCRRWRRSCWSGRRRLLVLHRRSPRALF